MAFLTPSPVLGGDETAAAGGQAGGKRHGASVKTLKRMLKKAGLRTTGRKAALTRRVKKAHLTMKGGVEDCPKGQVLVDGVCGAPEGGKRRRGRKSRMGKLGLMGY